MLSVADTEVLTVLGTVSLCLSRNAADRVDREDLSTLSFVGANMWIRSVNWSLSDSQTQELISSNSNHGR